MNIVRALAIPLRPSLRNVCWVCCVVVGLLVTSSGRLAGQEAFPRILNGTPTEEFPSVGIVGSVQDGGFCTGTLIDSRHVLTVAHCAEVIVGQGNATFEVGGQVYASEAILIHPNYNTFRLENDIAVIRLSTPVPGITPSVIQRVPPVVGDIVTLVGYGSGGTGASGAQGDFGTKRVGTTTIEELTATLVRWTFDSEAESNTAPGDSGGPGFVTIGGELFIACLTSGGTEPDAGLGDMAFNTRVDAYQEWIDSVLALADGGTGPGGGPPGNLPGVIADIIAANSHPLVQLIIVSLLGNQLADLLDQFANGSVSSFFEGRRNTVLASRGSGSSSSVRRAPSRVASPKRAGSRR